MFGVKDKVLLKKRQGLFTRLSKAQGSKAHLGGI